MKTNCYCLDLPICMWIKIIFTIGSVGSTTKKARYRSIYFYLCLSHAILCTSLDTTPLLSPFYTNIRCGAVQCMPNFKQNRPRIEQSHFVEMKSPFIGYTVCCVLCMLLARGSYCMLPLSQLFRPFTS